MRRVRHRLHPARHDALLVARADRLGAEHHGLESRPADLVDGERRNGAREACVDRRLTAGRLPDAALEHVPMITSSTAPASFPARRKAFSITSATCAGWGSGVWT